MKQPIAIIFNDAHLKSGNEAQTLKSCIHLIEYAEENSIDKVIFAGDLFDSRSFQRQSVLKTFEEILDRFYKANITLYMFPGNHDKTLYNSFDSFLDIYKHYPNVILNRELSRIKLGGEKGITIDLLPFFSDDMLVPMINEAEGADVLISHFEMEGSANLGHVSKKTIINKKLLSKWKKVYLGHYHNYHEISKDIIHLPSLRPSSFGEDNNKGFAILYDDLSYKLIEGDFEKYIKVEVNLDESSTEKINKLLELYKGSSDIIRFEISGAEAKLKNFDKSIFKDTGIDLKIKYYQKTFEELEALQEKGIIKSYDKNTIYDLFVEFCKEKNVKHKDGVKLLDKFFEENG